VKTIKLRAHGKINLALDVISKRSDGYHDVEMIMQSVSLFDMITIQELNYGIRLNSNWENIPLNKDNIAYKAAKLIMDRTGIKRGAEIFLHKNIPVAAGMG
jgi:4-diphosphocytidyl-2-C-methyl-D-erythritol kinase